MKNNKGYSSIVITAIVVGAVILGIAGYKFTKSYYDNRDKEENEVAVNNTCVDSPDYFVITKADSSGNAGDDILVKYKENRDQKFECEYNFVDGDFQLLNTDADGVELISSAQHFAYIAENLLIVDEGTGLNRSFEIYDLDEKNEIFRDNYSAGLFELNDNILSYWRTTKDIPNKQNCAKVDEYKEMGGAKIEGKIDLNIFDTQAKIFSDFRCSVVE